MFSSLNQPTYAGLLDQRDQSGILDDLHLYFGPHAPAFLATYATMRRRRGLSRMLPPTWSWQVLFTSYAWFYYRKLWLSATLIALAMALTVVLPPWPGNLISFGLTLLMCVYGKPWYLRAALNRIRLADQLGLEGQARRGYLMRSGGVSPWAAALASVAMALMLVWSIWPALMDGAALLATLQG